jgi:pyridoxamine 5'-phosphate oxidase
MDRAETETLDEVRDHIFKLWTGAVRNRHSPLHTPVVASVAADHSPSPRIMVLRYVADACTAFRFHTDVRSAKVKEIDASGPVTLLGYDPEQRVQLIVRGTGRVEQASDTADAAWDASALSSRRCYLAAHAPGTAVEAPISGLPENLLTRAPTLEESVEGRSNFGVLLIAARELEWLKLTSCGNRRALFTRQGEGWHGQWTTP